MGFKIIMDIRNLNNESKRKLNKAAKRSKTQTLVNFYEKVLDADIEKVIGMTIKESMQLKVDNKEFREFDDTGDVKGERASFISKNNLEDK